MKSEKEEIFLLQFLFFSLYDIVSHRSLLLIKKEKYQNHYCNNAFLSFFFFLLLIISQTDRIRMENGRTG